MVYFHDLCCPIITKEIQKNDTDDRVFLFVCLFVLLKLGHTCMECPVGLRGNLKVSLKDGSLSCRQTLVFFLMILFWVATFTTYSLTYRSDDTFNKWRRADRSTHAANTRLQTKLVPHLAGDLGSWTCKWCFCTGGSPRPVGPLLSSPPSSERLWSLPSLVFYHLKQQRRGNLMIKCIKLIGLCLRNNCSL